MQSSNDDIYSIFGYDNTVAPTINVNDILDTIDFEKNEYFADATTELVTEQIYAALMSIPEIASINVSKLMVKLAEYRYIGELYQLRVGRFVRWIKIPEVPTPISTLSFGGIIVDIQIADGYVNVVCKTPVGRFIKYNFNENLTFQKLTDEEKMILYVNNQFSTTTSDKK